MATCNVASRHIAYLGEGKMGGGEGMSWGWADWGLDNADRNSTFPLVVLTEKYREMSIVKGH